MKWIILPSLSPVHRKGSSVERKVLEVADFYSNCAKVPSVTILRHTLEGIISLYATHPRQFYDSFNTNRTENITYGLPFEHHI